MLNENSDKGEYAASEKDSKESEKADKEESLNLVKEVKEETSNYRKQFEKSWREYDDAYMGKQHKTGEEYKTVKNHIFKIIQGEVPILTDSLPGTTILAEREDRQDDALILEKSIKYVYADQNLQLILPTLVTSALVSAPGYLYTYYDPDAANGEGKIRYKQLPWEHVYLDGNASTIEDSAKARFEIPMRRDEIARIFPHKKDEILELKSDQVINEDATNEQSETRDVKNDGRNVQGKPKNYQAKDIVNYVETWIRSYDLTDIPEDETHEEILKEHEQLLAGEAPMIAKWQDHEVHIQDHQMARAQLMAKIGLSPESNIEQAAQVIDQLMQQNPAADLSPILLGIKICDNHLEEHEELKKLNPTSQMPKYKDGWRVIKSVAKVVLYDGPNPEQNGEIPLIPFYCYKDNTIYGFGAVKNIIDPQRTLNEVDFKEYKGLKRVANPGWLADKESGLTSAQLTNDDGIVIIKQKGTEVRRLEPGQISNQLPARSQSDAFAMEQIEGINEATQGIAPSANASGAAITKLQNQAIGRIRLKDRYLQHYSMKRLAKITASLILNNWSTEKRLRLNTDNAGIEELVFDPLRMADLTYQVEVTSGSMAGIDKEALNAYYLVLFDRKIIPDPKTFLMVSDFPKREIILKAYIEQENQAIQVQQQQDQAAQEQAQQELIAIKKENIKLKARISIDLLTQEEQQLYKEIMRHEAIDALTGSITPNIGQVNNQGM